MMEKQLNGNEKILNTIAPFYNGLLIGPELITTREYGRWVMAVYGEKEPALAIAATHITNHEGFPMHPGAYLNAYFKKNPVSLDENRQRSFHINSDVAQTVMKMGLAKINDVNKLIGAESRERVWLKFYTTRQVEIALDKLLLDFNLPSSNLSFFCKTNIIKCRKMPEWQYDKNRTSAKKGKPLFKTGAK